jgi:DNA-binding XRE family transcriptional regulator
MSQDIQERLKEARKRLSLNQIQIAADLDIQQKSISDIENGKIQNIPNTYIYYFYQKGISLDWIYDGKGQMLSTNISQATVEKKGMPLEGLFKDIDVLKAMPEQENKRFKENIDEPKSNAALYERIIESKDYNIQSLFAYIKSLENNLEYLKSLLDKALVNK